MGSAAPAGGHLSQSRRERVLASPARLSRRRMWNGPHPVRCRAPSSLSQGCFNGQHPDGAAPLHVWEETFRNAAASGCWKEGTAVMVLMPLRLRPSTED